MAFDAYKYAGTFEKLACKIIEKVISEQVVVSGTTKKTRDGGIDAIIYTKNNFITIEAKLRKKSVSLSLKDIASSVIFYLLRLNDKHYIVTNVYLASDTVNVLNRLNTTKKGEICYVDGDYTLQILKEIVKSLDDDEKELANILFKEFSDSKKSRKVNKLNNQKRSHDILLETQQELCNSIKYEIENGRKCVVLSGKIGTGKSTLTNAVVDQLCQTFSHIFIDCLHYNTVESFMYQLSNIQIGIDINELINEYISLSDEFENQSNVVCIDKADTIGVLTQILGRKQYSDSIKFLAQRYIDKLIEDFNSNKVCVVIDNYSAASPELDDFISSYILHSTEQLQFFIIKETDYSNNTNMKLEYVMRSPINIELFKEVHVQELDFTNTCHFISAISPNLSQACKKNLYSSFGGNMLMLRMAVEEMESTNNYNASLLRPLECEKIYKNKIIQYLNSNSIYPKIFFICWIMNSQLPRNILSLIPDSDIYDLLQKTGLFSENNLSITLCNICVYNVISKHYITHSEQLYRKTADFISELNVEKLTLISQMRVAFFTKSDDFVRLSEGAIPIFENKSEHDNIIETRALLYFYARDYINEDLLKIEAASNLIYEMIDYDMQNIRFDLDVSELVNEIMCYFKDFEAVGDFECLQDNEKSILSEARLKYALYLYFDHKRKNKFQQAYNSIIIPKEYMSHCQNPILISKIIRFQAICKKELGDKKEFFNMLSKGVTEFPQNKYLLAVYNANLAAEKSLENPIDALRLVDEALTAAKSADKYLHLWLSNDRLIYEILADKYNSEQVLQTYENIIYKADRLCSVTDRARANNTYGAFCLKNNTGRSASYEFFKNAIYTINKYEKNNIMAYFAVNYMQTLPTDAYEEFDAVAEMLLNWCINNIDTIVKKIKDPAISNKNNKIIMTLYSFADVLKKRNDQRYQLLIKIDGISEIFTDKIAMNPLFYIQKIPIILF